MRCLGRPLAVNQGVRSWSRDQVVKVLVLTSRPDVTVLVLNSNPLIRAGYSDGQKVKHVQLSAKQTAPFTTCYSPCTSFYDRKGLNNH